MAKIFWNCKLGHQHHLTPNSAERCDSGEPELVRAVEYSPVRMVIEIVEPGSQKHSSTIKLVDERKIICTRAEALSIYHQLGVLLTDSGILA